ncbi:hypothetical protein OE699_01115 [Sedimentimonas flavescens]|uniref:Uncharacterized protein n=1 Tax=Sedimentimonas flavescens TaxID=2851012 RepID=A0ABT2ZUX6_9RHOB|nr:hypothetical protein [Sedimentimonas flavescens]MCV2877438.1 hypothetical protein [Sedimentimonas flavescens]
MPKTDLTNDHHVLKDEFAARRYFAKFERITRIMSGVARQMEGELPGSDTAILAGYAEAVAATFRALSLKYLIAGRIVGPARRHLTIDLHESGFPIFQELVSMANDAAQAAGTLAGMAGVEDLKDRMVRRIVGERAVPTDLQFALSQRLYYEALTAGGQFWVQMHPVAEWRGDLPRGRRAYKLHWAVYDSQLNVPVVYILDVEDSGRTALPKDIGRWEQVRAHLMAQSVGGLKLITIAKGFDADFADLHPKGLRRMHLGPMYSSAYTLQSGPIREVLEDARAPAGEDWALAWAIEELEAERVEVEKGWFSETERQVFRLDPFSGVGEDHGATRLRRALILPQRPFQVLAEKDPPGFRNVRKFVVGAGDRVMVYG